MTTKSPPYTPAWWIGMRVGVRQETVFLTGDYGTDGSHPQGYDTLVSMPERPRRFLRSSVVMRAAWSSTWPEPRTAWLIGICYRRTGYYVKPGAYANDEEGLSRGFFVCGRSFAVFVVVFGERWLKPTFVLPENMIWNVH
jgi:hypothetical protein